MRLRLLDRNVRTETSEPLKQAFADVVVHREDVTVPDMHDDAVRHFVTVQNGATAGGTPNHIDPFRPGPVRVDLFHRLIPAKGDRVWVPSVQTQGRSSAPRGEIVRQGYIMRHIENTGTLPGVFEPPRMLSRVAHRCVCAGMMPRLLFAMKSRIVFTSGISSTSALIRSTAWDTFRFD